MYGDPIYADFAADQMSYLFLMHNCISSDSPPEDAELNNLGNLHDFEPEIHDDREEVRGTWKIFMVHRQFWK